MAKDRRYGTVKKLINSGYVNTIQVVLDIVPKTILGRDLSVHHITLAKMVRDPSKFTFGMTKNIASLVDVEHIVISKMILNSLDNPLVITKETTPIKANKRKIKKRK